MAEKLPVLSDDECSQAEMSKLAALLIKMDKSVHENIKHGLLSLLEDKSNALAVLKIKHCNGCTGYGVPFSAAFCDTVVSDENFYPFGSIFIDGLQLLQDFLDNPHECVPREENKRKILTKLLTFFSDKDVVDFVLKLEAYCRKTHGNETVIAIAMAEHLLGKLASENSYTLDSRYRKATVMECQCGCKTDIRNNFGNTSIGEEHVWNGSVDIVLSCSEQQLPVVVATEKEETSPEGTTPYEVKYRNLNQTDKRHQMIAQTIVFSFLEKSKKPDSNHSLIPCIGLSPREVIFYFYDSKQDILIQSVAMPLNLGDTLCFSTVIALWLVVNYKHLGTGLTGKLQELPTSNFVNLAGKMIDVYNNKLSLGNVWGSFGAFELHPVRIPQAKFTWPEGVRKVKKARTGDK